MCSRKFCGPLFQRFSSSSVFFNRSCIARACRTSASVCRPSAHQLIFSGPLPLRGISSSLLFFLQFLEWSGCRSVSILRHRRQFTLLLCFQREGIGGGDFGCLAVLDGINLDVWPAYTYAWSVSGPYATAPHLCPAVKEKCGGTQRNT